ncbi:G-protein coupled receptors family 1 profile domain-containing protein [Caenorhabditis elegans]|uniref:G-protein coupled receptors family 1 profile domain-containing protein n=1 Tax=Caenorhabditis elegans TaxID=6239 RepID=Q965R7_CAEEL|nr:G-protein coupled receptors family 1 profile domain-containing protein [Caenorhabditis elegans]CCD70062.1 G-protein coupled receptors family 1 profile domain-containing protein [Caenorhabditis elegans]|eukprot:NP_505037.1 Serpentine Receptor, class SX [Caenorhabditis elegans]
MYGTLARINQLVIVSYKIVYLFFGVFGNASLIYLIARRKKLQTKSSILQAIQCLCHIICLIGTQVDTVLTILDIKLPRNQCYTKVSIYTFFETVQAMIMLFLVVDILVIVKFPRFYHTFSTEWYIILALILPVIFGIIFFIWGFIETDDEIVIFCNPPLGLNITASTWFFRYILFLNLLTLIVFLILIRIFYAKDQAKRGDSWKVMKRLQISVVIFVCSWFIAQSANSVFIALGITGETFNFLVANVSFFVLLSFSQSFYVIIWKSKEYRQHFKSLWCFGSTGSRDVTGAHSSIKPGPIAMISRTF